MYRKKRFQGCSPQEIDQRRAVTALDDSSVQFTAAAGAFIRSDCYVRRSGGLDVDLIDPVSGGNQEPQE